MRPSTTALEFARSLGKLAIPTRDRAGFIVNRLLVPYMLDAIRAYEEGVGSVVEIDEAMKAGAGHPMGPLLLSDFVGLDTLGSICDVLFDEFRERRFAAPAGAAQDAGGGLVRAEERDGLLRLLGRLAPAEPGLLGMSDLPSAAERALGGGPERHREKALEQGKVPVRERVALLLDEGSFAEEALLANWQEEGLGADGVVTGLGRIDGRPVALMANDPTVKAGSWGPKTVEKILRIQERALELQVPMVYLVDSAGARITDQVQMFPGAGGRGRIFYNQVRLSGVVPQVCVLFGPSAAGGAYIPAFCDIVIMREGNASMYLGSPRMAEMVIGEQVSLEEMGGARMHTGVSGCGHQLRGQRRGGHRRRPPLPLLPAGQLARAAAHRPRRSAGPRRRERMAPRWRS